MKYLNRVLLLAGLIGSFAGLGGCLESADVTLHEPGKYQGASDPLLGSSDAVALQQRFVNQRDR